MPPPELNLTDPGMGVPPLPEGSFCSAMLYIPGHDISHTEYPGHLPKSHIWTCIDLFLMVMIVVGNFLIITAVRSNRKLSNVISNQFILNLALSDFFLGLTLPYHMAFYLCGGLGHHKSLCLIRFVLMSLACAASVYNLVIIAIDRYIAIVHPLHYNRIMTEWSVSMIIFSGWMVAFLISTVPIYWNTWESAVVCELDEVLDRYYLAAILLPAFLLVWMAMFVLYWSIWREAAGQAKRMRDSHCGGEGESVSNRKSIQVVLLICGCFSFCWLPFFIVAMGRSFDLLKSVESIVVYKALFSVAMSNSAMNPLIYAWKITEFKETFRRILHCKSANGDNQPFKPQKLENRFSIPRDTLRSQRSEPEVTVPQELVIQAPEQVEETGRRTIIDMQTQV